MPMQKIRKGDTVRIRPSVKHWHGASPESVVSHIAITEQLEGKSVEWMEKVSDAELGCEWTLRAASCGKRPRV